MKLIVGLGNPGIKYEHSRHNVGFMVLDELARKWTKGKVKWEENEKFHSLILQSPISNLQFPVTLAKPQTMMNASGYAVKKLVDFYHTELALLPSGTGLAETWVVHDDLDLPLGKIKIRLGGGTAGHHGLDSIIEQLGRADFVRFRLGIGRPVKGGKWEVGGGKLVSQNVKHKEVEDYILTDFETKEHGELKKMIKKAAVAIEVSLEDGLERAMNRLNLK